MVKTEKFKDNEQMKSIALTEPSTHLSLRSSVFQAKSNDIPPRTIDPHAIDISSIKGRFAWEKIPHGDTYIPVIFRYVNIILLSETSFVICNREKHSHDS